MKWNWRTEWPMWILIVAMLAIGAWSWNLVPERLPVHWNAFGQADRWGGRGLALFTMPIIAMVVYLVMLFAPRIDPGHAGYTGFAGPFWVFRLAFLGFLTCVDLAMIAQYHGIALNMIRIVLPLFGLLLAVVAWMLTHLQPNWLIGIRTPWTLSSRKSWDRAHQLGRRIFLIDAILFLLAGAIGLPWALYAALAATFLGALVVVAYSYFVWRDDPDKVPPAPQAPAR